MNKPIISIRILQDEVFCIKEALETAKSDEYKKHLNWQLFELEFIIKFIMESNIMFDYFGDGTIKVG